MSSVLTGQKTFLQDEDFPPDTKKYCRSGCQAQLCPTYAVTLVVCYFIPQLFCAAGHDLAGEQKSTSAAKAQRITELSNM